MDVLTPAQRRKNMQHIRQKDTSIEVRLRVRLWHEGIRYRKNYKLLPGKPDIAITKYRVAVFCDSSFWHGKDFETKRKPTTNAEYWDKKIRRNMERDREVERLLRSQDWIVLRFWDVEIKKNLDDCVQAVKEAIMSRKLLEDVYVFDDEDINGSHETMKS